MSTAGVSEVAVVLPADERGAVDTDVVLRGAEGARAVAVVLATAAASWPGGSEKEVAVDDKVAVRVDDAVVYGTNDDTHCAASTVHARNMALRL